MQWKFEGEDGLTYIVEVGKYNADKCLFINSEEEDGICTIRLGEGGWDFSPVISTDGLSDVSVDVLLFGLECWKELVRQETDAADEKEGGE